MERNNRNRKTETGDIALPSEIDDFLQIRYLKLHFYLQIQRDGYLPRSKASALRGGMGQMLLMSNCIRDGMCESCDFEEDCLVRRMMYPKMKTRPPFMTRQDSEGYVLECEDTQEFFAEGQILEFRLVLLGRTIVYFTQFLQAFHYLGLQGLGKDHVPFRVKRVTNSRGKVVVEGNDVFRENIEIMLLSDYVRYRLFRMSLEIRSENMNIRNNFEETYPGDTSRIGGNVSRTAFGTEFEMDEWENRGEDREPGRADTIVFHSPLTLKYRGEVQKSFLPEAVLAAVERRLFILNCFEGREEGKDYRRINIAEHIPELLDQRAYTEKMNRYSGTQKAKISFYGIEGYCRIAHLDDAARALLIAGELVHIGKNTSFGFGRYTLV